MGSLQKIAGIDISTIGTISDISELENNYDYVHVVLTGLQPFAKALKCFKRAIIFKHIVTPSTGFRNALTTKICYDLVNRLENRLVPCFSSKFVADSYFMDNRLLIPPSVDTSAFKNMKSVNAEKIVSLLDLSPVKSGIENVMGGDGEMILYSGPLTEDRFPYRKVLNAMKESKSRLLIIGRPTNNGVEAGKINEIIFYMKKLDLENRVSIALKLLTEDEKIELLNFSDIIIQPFTNSTQLYVAVDPPLFLLEAMSCGKPVITSETYSFRFLIKNGYNGYAINWDRSEELNNALEGCQRTVGLGLNARQTVLQGFSHSFVSKKIEALYDNYN